MSKLSLREINQSQLDTTPVINGQLIVCLDTGNAYRDSTLAHVKIGSDLEVVSELPLAPLANKIYFLKPDKLYISSGGELVLLNEVSKLSANKSATNGNAKIQLEGVNQTEVGIRGSGVTTVMTDENGEVVVDTMEPDALLEALSDEEIDAIVGGGTTDDGSTPSGNTVLVDDTLSVSGYAADAKVTGDRIRQVKQDIESKLSTKSDTVVPVSFAIPVTGWKTDSTITGFTNYIDIEIADVTANDIVNVNVAPASTSVAAKAQFTSTESFDGYLRLRAKNIPSAAITAQWYISK